MQLSKISFLSSFIFSLGLLASQGCVSLSPPNFPEVKETQTSARVRHPLYDFGPSPNNKYAIVIEGLAYFAQGTGDANGAEGATISNTQSVLDNAQAEIDPFVRQDVTQFTRLLLNKGYDVYQINAETLKAPGFKNTFFLSVPRLLSLCLYAVEKLANDETKLVVAYSGEGDIKGLNTCLYKFGNTNIVPSDAKITPADLYRWVGNIAGKQAVLLNACESGIFPNCILNQDLVTTNGQGLPSFNGIMIAACPEHHATTPNEASGCSALFGTFFNFYREDPNKVMDLKALFPNGKELGSSWTNFRHKFVDWLPGSSGLPISYNVVVFSNNVFDF